MGICVSASRTMAGAARIAAERAPKLLGSSIDRDAIERGKEIIRIRRQSTEDKRARTCEAFHSKRLRRMIRDRERSKIYAALTKKEGYVYRPLVSMVISRIAKWTGVPEAMIMGRGRSARLVIVRQACMYWARRLTGKSLPQISRVMGGFDHTTALHACRVYPAKRAKMGRKLKEIA